MSIVEKFRKNEFVSFPFYNMTRNKTYWEYYKFFKESSDWSQEKLRNWEWEKIVSTVKYAYYQVPFYYKLYKAAGFQPEDLKTWEDFKLLPVVTKEMIKKYEKELYSDQLEKLKSRIDYTGGSTGQPMKFRIDDEFYYREDAVYRYYWQLTGFNVGQKCIILRGQKIADVEKKIFYEYNRFWNYMYLDSSYINMENMSGYDKAIKKFGAQFIQAYPSSLTLLAKMYQLSTKTAPQFKNIYLSSENVYPEQIELFKEVFRPAKILNQYGHSEKVLLALQNPDGEGLGFMPQYGYMELLDKAGNTVEEKGKLGEIVGTGFSKSMPFIRYKTSDCAAFSNNYKSEGIMKNWKFVNKIEGRLHEFILTSDNRLVSICTVGGSHIKELNSVLDMQYEQIKKGEIIIRVVENPKHRLTVEEKKRIQLKFQEIMENQIQCKVITVDTISRSNRNKKAMLIQNLDINGVS